MTPELLTIYFCGFLAIVLAIGGILHSILSFMLIFKGFGSKGAKTILKIPHFVEMNASSIGSVGFCTAVIWGLLAMHARPTYRDEKAARTVAGDSSAATLFAKHHNDSHQEFERARKGAHRILHQIPKDHRFPFDETAVAVLTSTDSIRKEFFELTNAGMGAASSASIIFSSGTQIPVGEIERLATLTVLMDHGLAAGAEAEDGRLVVQPTPRAMGIRAAFQRLPDKYKSVLGSPRPK